MTFSFIVFLNCACVGIFTGFASDLSYLIKKIFKNNYLIDRVVDFCVFFIGSSFIFVIANSMNNNIFALYEILGFFMGAIIEKISCKNLFAKFFDMIYNGFIKLILKLKTTKFGQKVFK